MSLEHVRRWRIPTKGLGPHDIGGNTPKESSSSSWGAVEVTRARQIFLRDEETDVGTTGTGLGGKEGPSHVK